ncbi:metallophosphoesterase [Paenibacillus xylanexedens]|uniref:metallophosphoesterase family protein n=1 Tax=Paenibacillus xylanexedens TaxID=528191 RepID=UPI001F19D8EC|nr:metallophosphoesterase [Paenibacillus xylanexedens]MCF7757960.1 metallophosphoesterase [Paenibacillus xylanexedens]
MKISLMGLAGMKIRAGDGLQELGYPEMLSTPVFYLAQPGDQIRLIDPQYKFNVATYTPKIEDRWIYTYDYAPEESWTVYRQDLNGDTYRQNHYTFSECVYFRICLRKMDGTEFEGHEDINHILSFEREKPYLYEMKAWLKNEIERVSKCIMDIQEKGELSFVLLTDTHYTVNGTWDDTSASIQELHREVGFDGIIHLGDFTDGMTTREVSRHYVEQVLNDLKKCEIPVWAALGNHDTNYFKNNPEPFSLKEQCELYLGRDEPRYAIDFESQRLRFIFLDSFDPNESLRYGYNTACIQWLTEQLKNTSDDWRVIVISHVAPVRRLQYWAKKMRGEEELMKVLHDHSAKIMAFINGHNHADLIDNAEGFPILSILNSKCEAFTEYKSAGFITPNRKIGDTSQEAFEIMLVNTEKRQIRFVRFGAGKDKIVTHGRAEWL